LNQCQSQQESTAQWANKVFGSKLVTTNQSCQDIPSQSMDTYGISEQVNEKDRLALTSGKLWEDQAEEDYEEGEIPDGIHGEDEANHEGNEEEEQRVNDNTTNIVNNEKISSMQLVGSEAVVSQIENLDALMQCQKGLMTDEFIPIENVDIQGFEAVEKCQREHIPEGKFYATTAVPENTLALNRVNTLSPDRVNILPSNK